MAIISGFNEKFKSCLACKKYCQFYLFMAVLLSWKKMTQIETLSNFMQTPLFTHENIQTSFSANLYNNNTFK